MVQGVELKVIAGLAQLAQEKALSDKIKVGAVVVGIDKHNQRQLFTGSNLHVSDSFADIHAEQMAINLCLTKRCYPVAIYVTSTSKEELVTLCGSCRHYLSEINNDMQVVILNPDGTIKIVKSLSEVYPFKKDTKAKNEIFQRLCLGMVISA